MSLYCGRKFSQKVSTIAWRAYTSQVDNSPYWRAKFPDRIASFDEIPTIVKRYDPHNLPEEAEGWFRQYGHVVKERSHFGKYNVHLFHFEDMDTVYANDGKYPIRQSHNAIVQYRRERKQLYDKVGLGGGNGQEWYDLRTATTRFVRETFFDDSTEDMMEKVMDDLVKVIRNNLNDKGEIELLPWLFRWAFESIGAISWNRRLNALSETGNERADKLVAASSLTDEIIALTTLDPINKYEERYQRLVEAQDFVYSEMRKYLDDIKRDMMLEMTSDGIAQTLLRNNSCSENDAITVILDLFHGAMQTVPLTALMAFYNLARHSDVQAQLRKETKDRMPTKDSSFYRASNLTKDCLLNVVLETLRLNPPIIGNGRIIQKDLVLGGYLVPAYTNTILHFQVPSRLEENYIDPRKFILGRDYKLRHIFYLFGDSSRRCPGQNFALRQLLLIVAKLTRNFEFSYDGGEVKMANKLHNRPVEPLILRLKPVEE